MLTPPLPNDLPAPQAPAEAERALHDLVTGAHVRTLIHGSKRIDFHAADIPQLRAYIARLRGGRVSTVLVSTSKGF